VRSIVNRSMAGVHGEGSSSLGRSRLGLTGRRRVPAPFTQWPPQDVRNQGSTQPTVYFMYSMPTSILDEQIACVAVYNEQMFAVALLV
jgi:hypothetical protein